MKALILATGSSTPWRSQLGGEPLLIHQLDAVETLSPTGVTAIVRREERSVADLVGNRTRLLVGAPDCSTLRSFLLADAPKDALLVVNAAVLAPAARLRKLVSRPDSSTLAFDSSITWDESHIKIQKRGDRLARITRDIPPALSSGIFAGAVYLTAADAAAVFRVASELAGEASVLEWTAALNVMAQNRRIACVDVAGTPWCWVESDADLAEAEATIWPAIVASPTASSRDR